jgi:bifunctional DNA-binding transcriptional regulator/antitoxin component of YhaV-PrlF toxin-antitoxin module
MTRKEGLDGGEWGIVSAMHVGNSTGLTIPSKLRKLLQVKTRDRFVVYYARQGDAALIVYRKTLNDSALKILKAAMKK